MAEDDPKPGTPNVVSNMMKEVGGVFKFGHGVLGKSAIALGVLFVPIAIAAFRLQSDAAIIGDILIGAVLFLLWYGCMLKFSGKHPETVLLDGAEWTGYKRFEASAKGFIPSVEVKHLTIIPGARPTLTSQATNEADREIGE